MTESPQWFVRKGQKIHGPFTSRQLRKLASESQIKPDTTVRKGEAGSWIAAQKIKGLFATEPIRAKEQTVVEAAEPVIEPVQPTPVNTGQLKARWKPIAVAVVAVAIVTVIFAIFSPWLALLAAIILLAGGIAFAAWPPMAERIAQLRNRTRPSAQQRIYNSVPIILYGAILLALSQSQIRSNWSEAEVRADVAREIENAKTALEQQRLDEALRICDLLDSKANADEKSQVAAVRARAHAMHNANRVTAANDEVRQLISGGLKQAALLQIDEAQSALDTAMQTPFATEFRDASELKNAIAAGRTRLAQRDHANRVEAANDTVRRLLADCNLQTTRHEFDEAQSTLETAVQTPFATDFLNASELADEIVAERMKLVQECLDAGDVAGAKEQAQKAIHVPSASDIAEAKQVIIEIANREVAVLVESARESLENMHRDEAAAALETALAITDATETDAAKQMLGEIRDAREAEVNKAIAAFEVFGDASADVFYFEHRALDLYEKQITDTVLEPIKALTGLGTLNLGRTRITDAGLKHLKGLTNLQVLVLSDTRITDAGLKHLNGLTRMEILDLADTQITDAALETCSGFTGLQKLLLQSTRITDAGLEHLKGLTSLRNLDLSNTRVTGTGVEALRVTLPRCNVRRN